MLHRPWHFLVPAISLLLSACSGGPSTPQGEQPLADARSNLKSSDFKAALRNLDKAIKAGPDDASRQQAVALRTALVTAFADANKQMAETYAIGAKQPAAQSTSGAFYKARSDYYNTANSYLMDAMQSVMDQRSKLNGNVVTLEVGFPGFTGTNPILARIKTGQLASDSEAMNAELQADRNALAVVLSAVAGQDPNKGEQLFSSGKVTIDPRVYLIELSNSFMQTGAIYEYRGLNQPDRQRTVDEVVHANLDIAQKLLDSKPDKDLEARLKKLQRLGQVSQSGEAVTF